MYRLAIVMNELKFSFTKAGGCNDYVRRKMVKEAEPLYIEMFTNGVHIYSGVFESKDYFRN
jgi:hypothetical protein